mgnify:CR=1 FL=1
MYSVNIGSNSQGCWKISNYLEKLSFLFDRLPFVQWQTSAKLLYSIKNIDRTAEHLNLSSATVTEWLDDPVFSCYKETVVEFSPLDRSEISIRDYLSNLLNLSINTTSIFLQDQQPGGITPLHLDGKKHMQYNLKEDEEYLIERYIIFLEDQHPGQFWQINEDFIKWKKGDILTWDQSTSPHATANAGYYNRPVIMVTGVRK